MNVILPFLQYFCMLVNFECIKNSPIHLISFRLLYIIVWYGTEALKKNLCDEIATSDDVLLRMRADGSDIYSVTYRDPKDRVNIFEELLTRVAAKVVDAIVPDIARVGNDGWGVMRRTEQHQAYGSLDSNDHFLVKEDLGKHPQLRYP